MPVCIRGVPSTGWSTVPVIDRESICRALGAIQELECSSNRNQSFVITRALFDLVSYASVLHVVFHVVLCHCPGGVRIVLIHGLKGLQSIGTEILLVHDAIGPNNECHHAGHPVLSGCSCESESADHRATHHEVYFSSGGSIS